MKIQVNGEGMDVAEGATVADLVGQLGLAGKSVAVERNLEIVPRARHAETPLSDGDRLEIVTLVGGG
ncbi:MAG: sulfur carrier protein ThiS [Planctomycetota bacterium]|jgi:sulfur carrier protein